MGDKNPHDIKYNLHLHRLVTSLFIHSNFMHLVGNITLLIIIGSFYEHKIGSLKFTISFLINGISANVFTCAISDSNTLGSSISIIGIWGAIISLISIFFFIIISIGSVKSLCYLIIHKETSSGHCSYPIFLHYYCYFLRNHVFFP